MPELGPYGSVRGALSNERPYRDLRNVDANYLFERSHRFAGIQPNSGFGDYSRLSCGVGDTQLGRRPGFPAGAAICRALFFTRLRRLVSAYHRAETARPRITITNNAPINPCAAAIILNQPVGETSP
jgi:hypothetical protein